MSLPRADSPRASIVIRTYNESRHLPAVLNRLSRQKFQSFEVVIVDSGSTDNSVEIAELAGARIEHIRKVDFTFGRSLNVGCRAAKGEILIFISGHCYPMDPEWLGAMVAPFDDDSIGLAYGKQRGGSTTKFSEHRHFAKTFPNRSSIPQEGFFCNNANCAIRRSLWERHHFDEELTGLEDLDWAKWMVTSGKRAAYAANAGVLHIHDETWPQVFRRYEREAIALKRILPEMSFSIFEFARLFLHSTALDLRAAAGKRVLLAKAREIVAFRAMQYWGTYRGANYHHTLTRQIKERFFYPK